jgi:hypothetical protein
MQYPRDEPAGQDEGQDQGREDSGESPVALVSSRGAPWFEPFLFNGYNLRMFNSFHALFGGRIELVLPLIAAWIARQAAHGDAVTSGLARETLADLGLYRGAGGPLASLRVLGAALGLARETLRRAIDDLEAQGWLIRVGGEMPLPGPRAEAHLRSSYYVERLRDFLWTEQRIAEFYERRPIPASRVGDIESAIRACRTADLPAGLQDGQRVPTPDTPLARQAAVVVASYNLRQTIALHRALGGDILLGLILGEIAHYSHASLAAVRPAASWDELISRLGDESLARSRQDGRARACSAHSLTISMGVPAETMRRKLAKLVERGWVDRDEDGRYWPRPGLDRAFEEFDRPRFTDFRRSAQRVLRLLAA